ncbi:hypothetical protein B566_EDAN015442 [Ephemera danica]|nr:hypothetical protein B566_EDAN015442 [Ephemera danica]
MATDSEDMWREGGLVQRHRHLLDTGFMSDCSFLVDVDGGEKKKEEEEIKDIQLKHFQEFLNHNFEDPKIVCQVLEFSRLETIISLTELQQKCIEVSCTLRN